MSTKWKETTALALCCALLLLSVTAELAHRHADRFGSATENVAKSNSHEGLGGAISLGLSCVACVHAIATFATETSAPSSSHTFEASLLTGVEETFNTCRLTSFHSNRAPPFDFD
ncbi:hypothetical protein MJD09_12000 [bacterium]|nr:hypothetical protein [bacterium]